MFRHPLSPDADLRLLEQQHAAELFALIDRNRDYLLRWVQLPDCTHTVEDPRIFIRQSLRRFADEGSPLFGIWYRDALAGAIDVQHIDWHHCKSVLGYWLGEEFQGKGLMTMAARAVVNHLFSSLMLNRVEINVKPDNLRSRAVAERLGFHHEGSQRQAYRLHGQFTDNELYALLREEWPETTNGIILACPLTAEIELRLLQMNDAEALFTLIDANRAHLLPWMSWVDSTNCVDDSRAFIQRKWMQLAENSEIHFSIWYQGNLAGIVGTLPINWHNRKVEIGYWLGEAYQGKGLVSITCRAMLTYLFETLGLNRVEIRLNTLNTRSRAVTKRLGFHHEGTFRQEEMLNGRYADFDRYALLHEDWKGSNRS